MLGVGLTAVRKTTGIPLEMPPLTPALWLVAVTMVFPFIRKASLASEPFRSAKPKPVPNSMPLTAGTEKAMWESRLSTLSKYGSPTPAGRPRIAVSRMPPTLSPSAPAARMAAFIGSSTEASSSAKPSPLFSSTLTCAASAAVSSSAKGVSERPAQRAMWVVMSMPARPSAPSTMAPPATSAAVIRPEKCPPPRAS